MPKKTKAELLQLLESMKDEDVLTYFDQAELDEIITKRLAKEKPKQENALAQIAQLQAQLDEAKTKYQTVISDKENEGKTQLERYQAELAKLQNAHKMLQQEKEAEIARRNQLEARRKEDFLSRELQTRLLKAGANPATIDDAVLIAKARLAESLSIDDTNGAFKLKAINPTTLTEMDVGETINGFLEARLNLKKPKPSGAGSESAGPGGSPNRAKWDEGMSDSQAMSVALRDHYAREAKKAE